jgi:hypothetical protein
MRESTSVLAVFPTVAVWMSPFVWVTAVVLFDPALMVLFTFVFAVLFTFAFCTLVPPVACAVPLMLPIWGMAGKENIDPCSAVGMTKLSAIELAG